ncbi:AsnC family transcriptional regulator [Streptomyces violens]|uniref:AsnC family transcriptional regulator n=1 Tax=Streptomyces violens TaxID=66377 RepID=UPI000AABBB96
MEFPHQPRPRLLAVARDPTTRIRDIAAACRIAERTAQAIVCDLEAAGYLSRERIGRRTHCTLNLNGSLRHPAEAGLSIRALLDLFTLTARAVKPRCDRTSKGG